MGPDQSYQKLLRRIAGNVKKAREQRGLTQEQMGRLGFNYRHYQRIESGRHSINLHTLHRLAEKLGVNLRQFFD